MMVETFHLKDARIFIISFINCSVFLWSRVYHVYNLTPSSSDDLNQVHFSPSLLQYNPDLFHCSSLACLIVYLPYCPAVKRGIKRKTKRTTDKLSRYSCSRPFDVCPWCNRSGRCTGHYGRVQQRGTKETNNGLMEGDGGG